MEKQKALIGMSGGVDSSVAALLMQEAGYECIGATMRLFSNAVLGQDQESTCCSLDDVEDAKSVARRMGIAHYTFNFQEDFREKVMDAFVKAYESGLTPNPCIECNRFLKFDHLLRRALELGCAKCVTGHYARIRYDASTGRYLLYKAVDCAKDQTYFLANLTQEQLAHTAFPLGELTKAQVRQIAGEHSFINARKHDSQDICFVPDGNYKAFMERYTGKTYESGNFLDLQGNVVGRHNGAVGYTLGQRKGLGLAMGVPVYVCGKDMAANTVTVGPNEALFATGLIGGDWNWFPFPDLKSPMRVSVRTRHTPKEADATIIPMEGGLARVEFDIPQRAVTPGQAVVVYSGDMVVGGGTILKAVK